MASNGQSLEFLTKQVEEIKLRSQVESRSPAEKFIVESLDKALFTLQNYSEQDGVMEEALPLRIKAAKIILECGGIPIEIVNVLCPPN
jgi:hypothetical protein